MVTNLVGATVICPRSGFYGDDKDELVVLLISVPSYPLSGFFYIRQKWRFVYHVEQREKRGVYFHSHHYFK